MKRQTVARWAPLFISIAVLATTALAAEVRDNASLPIAGRSVVVSPYGIVSATQTLAARAGTQVLERGGNAVDAAIAANAAMGLMEPFANGVGGDLFVIIRLAKTGKMYGLNAGGWAPTGLTADFLREQGIKTMPKAGIHSVTVPGVVAGWAAMHERFGQLAFADILAPAIFYAEHGFPVAEQAARPWAALNEDSPYFRADFTDPNLLRTYRLDGQTPRAGEMFRNPNLGKTLRYIAEQGRDGYYTGPIADAILTTSDKFGGTLTAADLAEFEPEWVEPISTTYRGWTVSEIGPNTQGIAALMMLNIMERFPLGKYGFHSAKTLHVMIEAKKLAYADMLHYVGDPRFSTIPVPEMLNKRHATIRAALINPVRANCAATPSEFHSVTSREGSDTTYISAIDHDGNIVSLIQSNYMIFGSGLVPTGTGFVLQNRGALFTLEPGHPNTLVPRKRPIHTIIPAFMSRGDTHIGFGILGGWNQAQAHAQFVAHVVDYGMNIQQAFEAGRFTQFGFNGCDLIMESKVPASEIETLRSLGHEISVMPPRTGFFGMGSAAMSNGSGVNFGSSDPASDGASIPQAPAVFVR